MSFHMLFGFLLWRDPPRTPVSFCNRTWLFVSEMLDGVLLSICRRSELFRTIVFLSQWARISQSPVDRVCVDSGLVFGAISFVAVGFLNQWASNSCFLVYLFNVVLCSRRCGEHSSTTRLLGPGAGIANILVPDLNMASRIISCSKPRRTAKVFSKCTEELLPSVYSVNGSLNILKFVGCFCTAKLLG